MIIEVTPSFYISEHELDVRFVRAGGPGGQHVNKVATAVQLRFDTNSQSLPPHVREKLGKIAAKRINSEGVLVIEAREYRSQARNRDAAVERLVALLREAAKRPKKRKATRPSRAAKERRLDSKRKQSDKKAGRRGVNPSEY